MNWKQKKITQFDAKSISDIFNNHYGFIKIDNFLNNEQCAAIVNYLKQNEVIKGYDYDFDSAQAPEALHHMTTHYLFEEDQDPHAYLAKAAESIQQYDDLSNGSGVDVMALIDQKFEACGFEVNVPQENGQAYSRAMIRSLKKGALVHADYAPFLTRPWIIRSIDSELAWNVFLESPESGGECVVYDKQWTLDDQKHVVKDSYGYDRAVVAGKSSAQYQPQKGHLVIFNSRNFHEVLPASGTKDRITMGGHFGRQTDRTEHILSWV